MPTSLCSRHFSCSDILASLARFSTKVGPENEVSRSIRQEKKGEYPHPPTQEKDRDAGRLHTRVYTHCRQPTAHSSQPTDHSTQLTAHSSQHTAHSTQHAAHRTQDTGHRPQDTAHRTPPAAHSAQPTGHRAQHGRTDGRTLRRVLLLPHDEDLPEAALLRHPPHRLVLLHRHHG
jgi:hypothetical protein